VKLLEEIKREHELSERFLKEGFWHSKKAGELVLELQSKLEPEEFEQWLKWNGVLTEGKAEKYMQLCKLLSSGEEVAVKIKVGEKAGSSGKV